MNNSQESHDVALKKESGNHDFEKPMEPKKDRIATQGQPHDLEAGSSQREGKISQIFTRFETCLDAAREQGHR